MYGKIKGVYIEAAAAYFTLGSVLTFAFFVNSFIVFDRAAAYITHLSPFTFL